MQFKRILRMGGLGVFFVFICLFFIVWDVGAACTPGQRLNHPNVPAGVEQPWVGENVPITAFPPGFPGTGTAVYFHVFPGMSCGTPGNWECFYWCYPGEP